MKTVNFSDFYEFVDHVVCAYNNIKNVTNEVNVIGVSVVSPYSSMIEILNILVKESSFSLYSIEIEDCNVCGYDGDFILQIDPDGNVWVQRTSYESGNTIFCEDNIIFVNEDANSNFIVKNKGENIVCFAISDKDDNEEFNPDDFKLGGVISCEDEMHGFTASKTDGNAQMWCSFYSSEKLDKNDYKELLREFGFSN